MELRAYHLRKKRVSGHNSDMTSKIEDITVKLVGESSFEKYCKLLPISGFVKADPPKIVKVLERKDGVWNPLGKDAINEAQKRVDELIKSISRPEKVDYKAELSAEKKRNDDLEERLLALEGNNKSDVRDLLEIKATDLDVQFRSNIGDAKLLEKIQAIEPDFKV